MKSDAAGGLVPGQGLVFDLGMHRGDDTAFYLKKGFSVVAVEANPALARAGRERFAGPIAEGRLEVVEAAIASEAGEVEFFVNRDNDEWSSTDAKFGLRSGTRAEAIRVPAITFASLLDRFPGVYSVKCDLEGADLMVLRDLVRHRVRPRFVSVEAVEMAYLAHLCVAGYGSFKIVSQGLNHHTRLPRPAREGLDVEHEFPRGSSGPFGEEAAGEWMSLDAVSEVYLCHLRLTWSAPHMTTSWYDFHARYGAFVGGSGRGKKG
jgi:FkbM family methyltransferase